MQSFIRLVKKDLEENLIGKGLNLYITGHSLGGAMQSILCLELEEIGVEYKESYNFGSPRVGNLEFKRFYNNFKNQSNYRVINNNDVITRVPIGSIPIFKNGYFHVGREVYLNRQGKMYFPNPWESDQPKIGKWALFWDMLLGRKRRLDQFRDHHIISGYGARLKELAGLT